jgi:ACT domain-containing protein
VPKTYVITVLGQDKPGIVATVSGCLAENGANIIDISQTVLQDLFSMIMMVSVDENTDLPAFKAALQDRGAAMGLQVMVQHEDVFRYMHRI